MEEGYSLNIMRDKDLTITIYAPYIEIVVTLETMIIVIQIQLWQVLVPFFLVRVQALTTFYVDIYLIDHKYSFMW